MPAMSHQQFEEMIFSTKQFIIKIHLINMVYVSLALLYAFSYAVFSPTFLFDPKSNFFGYFFILYAGTIFLAIFVFVIFLYATHYFIVKAYIKKILKKDIERITNQQSIREDFLASGKNPICDCGCRFSEMSFEDLTDEYSVMVCPRCGRKYQPPDRESDYKFWEEAVPTILFGRWTIGLTFEDLEIQDDGSLKKPSPVSTDRMM